MKKIRKRPLLLPAKRIKDINNNKLKNFNCLYCKGPKKRIVEIFCSVQCQKDYQYIEYIENWLKGKVSGIKADGVLSGHVRRHLLAIAKERCSICGWSERNKSTGLVPLEIDHIDGNYKNNKPKNLRVLCPNCHSLTPTHRALNKGFGRPRQK